MRFLGCDTARHVATKTVGSVVSIGSYLGWALGVGGQLTARPYSTVPAAIFQMVAVGVRGRCDIWSAMRLFGTRRGTPRRYENRGVGRGHPRLREVCAQVGQNRLVRPWARDAGLFPIPASPGALPSRRGVRD